jgi:hypothetical protein
LIGGARVRVSGARGAVGLVRVRANAGRGVAGSRIVALIQWATRQRRAAHTRAPGARVRRARVSVRATPGVIRRVLANGRRTVALIESTRVAVVAAGRPGVARGMLAYRRHAVALIRRAGIAVVGTRSPRVTRVVHARARSVAVVDGAVIAVRSAGLTGPVGRARTGPRRRTVARRAMPALGGRATPRAAANAVRTKAAPALARRARGTERLVVINLEPRIMAEPRLS